MAFQFTDVIARKPAKSVVNGLRDGAGEDPDFDLFVGQHEHYLDALRRCEVEITLLEAQENFPDSVFVEDAAICFAEFAILTRPGAPSRFAEPATLKPALASCFARVVELPGNGYLDGGDVLLAGHEVFVGLSSRTNQAGIDALKTILIGSNYRVKQVTTPASILHFKTACGLLDNNTIFCTAMLAESGCFKGYELVLAIDGEEAAANLIRVNDYVIISAGFTKTRKLLEAKGYQVIEIATSEAAKIDAGVSCMSLRLALNGTG